MIRIVVLLAAVAVGMVSIYFVLGQRYARQTEVNELNNRVVSLEAAVEEWKSAFQNREYATPSDLAEVSRELDTLEAGFQDRQQRSEQALQGIQETLSTLQASLEAVETTYLPRNELLSVLEASRFISADPHPVNIDLGPLPASTSERIVHTIPETVPDTAREILLYIYVATGYVRGGVQEFRLSVNLDEDREAVAYLYAFASVQSAWSYNSDNVWLPMPQDRKIRLQVRGDTALFGDWRGQVRLIAYR